MAAWAELVNANGDDKWLSLCEAALLEVQRETLHRAAEKVRRLAAVAHIGGEGELSTMYASVAGVIDPGVDA